jgi:hypothetical protein
MFMRTRSLVALLQLQLIWVESELVWSNFRPRIIYQFGVFAKLGRQQKVVILLPTLRQ